MCGGPGPENPCSLLCIPSFMDTTAPQAGLPQYSLGLWGDLLVLVQKHDSHSLTSLASNLG
jgi:hypothetical protein